MLEEAHLLAREMNRLMPLESKLKNIPLDIIAETTGLSVRQITALQQ